MFSFELFIRSSLIDGRFYSYYGISFENIFENENLKGIWMFLSKLIKQYFMLISRFLSFEIILLYLRHFLDWNRSFIFFNLSSIIGNLHTREIII